MDKKETIILHRGQIESLLSLSSLKDVKTILRAMLSYGIEGVEPEIPEHLVFGWIGFRHLIDYDNEQYNDMVEKRRSAAKKRWEMQKDANDASASSALQANANDAHNHNLNQDYILSPGARVCAYGDDAESISRIFPRAKVGDDRQLVKVIIAAIQREIDKGLTTADAVQLVCAGTQNYANAMKGKPKKFLAKPEDFYGKGQYNFDPEVWEHLENAKSGSKDVLHNNPQFAANERGLEK